MSTSDAKEEDKSIVEKEQETELQETTNSSSLPTSNAQEESSSAEKDPDVNSSSLHRTLSRMPSSVGGFLLIGKPFQRQRWGDTQLHPHVDWGGLFFDLYFVAAAYNLGNILLQSPNNEGLLYFCACCGPIFQVWMDDMYYNSRFGTPDDVFHRFFDVAVYLALGIAVVNIRPVEFLSNPTNHNEMFVFCLAILLGDVLACLRYVEILFWVDGQPVAKVAARRVLKIKILPLACELTATIYAGLKFYGNGGDDGHRLLAATSDKEEQGSYEAATTYETTDVSAWLLIGSVVAGNVALLIWMLSMPGGGRHKAFTVPMNIDFAIHRYGEFTMLMLGESILSLLIVEVSENSDYYTTFYCGILSVVFLQYMHFRSQPHDPDKHAMRRTKEAGFLFSRLIFIYSAALIILGSSYKMLMYEFFHESNGGSKRMLFNIAPRWLAGGNGALKYATADRQQREARFFSASLAVVFACSDIMIMTHRGLKDNLGRCIWSKQSTPKKIFTAVLVLLRAGMIAFIATLSLYETDPEHLAVIGLAAIVGQIILRVVMAAVLGEDDQVHMSLEETKNAMAAVQAMDGVLDADEEDETERPDQAEAEPKVKDEAVAGASPSASS